MAARDAHDVPTVDERDARRRGMPAALVVALALTLALLWTAPAADWTQKRIWAGEDMKADHAYHEKK